MWGIDWLEPEIILLAVAAITGIAVYRLQKRTAKNQEAVIAPVIILPYGTNLQRNTELPIQISYKFSSPEAVNWQVLSVRVKNPKNCKVLSSLGEMVQDGHGGIEGYKPVEWLDSLSLLHSPGEFLLSNSAPDAVELEFNISLKSNATFKSVSDIKLNLQAIKNKDT